MSTDRSVTKDLIESPGEDGYVQPAPEYEDRLQATTVVCNRAAVARPAEAGRS